MMKTTSNSGRSIAQVCLLLAISPALAATFIGSWKTLADSASTAVCQANLRSLGQAIQAYSADNDGRLVDACNSASSPWVWWTNYLLPYAESVRVFYCPSHAALEYPAIERLGQGEVKHFPAVLAQVGGGVLLIEENGTVIRRSTGDLSAVERAQLEQVSGSRISALLPVTWDQRYLSYGMNHRLGSRYQRETANLEISKIGNPDQLVVLGDSSHLLLRATRAMWREDVRARHEGKANFLYLSGRVELLDPQTDSYPVAGGTGLMNPQSWIPEVAK